jgi:hypothetical protein
MSPAQSEVPSKIDRIEESSHWSKDGEADLLRARPPAFTMSRRRNQRARLISRADTARLGERGRQCGRGAWRSRWRARASDL